MIPDFTPGEWVAIGIALCAVVLSLLVLCACRCGALEDRDFEAAQRDHEAARAGVDQISHTQGGTQ